MVGLLVLAAIAAVGMLLLAGQLARRRLRRRYPPIGRMVDVGGHRLHLVERGRADGPTVVLVGGIWAPALAWEPVMRDLAHFARVVAYDRAGLGWSEPGTSRQARTTPAMADELAALLDSAAVPRPYLLVGHSLGGAVVRVFAHRHPDRTAGVILVDASHEDQLRLAPPALRAFMASMDRRMPAMFRVIGLAVRSGLLALVPGVVPAAFGPLPDDLRTSIKARIAAEPSVVATMARESADLEAGNDAIRAMDIRSLGAVPLLVISHGRPEGVPPRFGPEVAAAYEATWQQLQIAQASLSPLGRRVVAVGVGHDIPTEGPRYIVDGVREMLGDIAAARTMAS